MECPKKPNCVSSLSQNPAHAVEPLLFDVEVSQALIALRRVLAGLPRLRMVQDNGRELQAELRSRVFRFVDDLHFQLDDEAGMIHLCSAARLGWWDFGVNRRRVERLRRRFNEELESLRGGGDG